MLVSADVRRRRLLGLAAAVAATALTVSGCAAGQDAQTVEQTSVVDGTAFEAGAVNLRDVGVRAPVGPSYAAGANAALQGLMVNTARDEDRLVSITTPAADSVVFYSDGLSAVLGTAPTGSASPSDSSSPSDTSSDTSAPTDGASPSEGITPSGGTTATEGSTPSDGASSSSSVTPSAGASATGSSSSSGAAPTPATDIPLPSDQAVQFGYSNDQPAIVLVGLKQALFPSEPLALTFTFASGATVTALVTVKLPVDSTLEAPTINAEEQEGGGE
ncbi:hypothetical protein ACXR2U_01220 [Jatrophihabitans sp. YIM 134969]